MKISLIALLASAIVVVAIPTPLLAGRDSKAFQKQNGLDAQKLNSQFAKLKKDDSCDEGSQACVEGGFAQCVSGKWVLTGCSGGTTCFALPLVNKAGTSLACDSTSDALACFKASGVDGTGSPDDTKDQGSGASNANLPSSTDDGDMNDSGDSANGGNVSSEEGDSSGDDNSQSTSSPDCGSERTDGGVDNASSLSKDLTDGVSGHSSIIVLDPRSSTPTALQRRQAVSGFSSVQIPVVATSAAASIASASISTSIPTQSAVLGSDGTATVTVVSTVTVFMSFVPVSTSGVNPSDVAVPIANPAPAASASINSTFLSSSILASASLPSASAVSSIASASSVIATSVPSSAFPSSSASPQTLQGFSFETAVAAAPTAVPPTDNNGAAVNSPIDIASLLTATVAS